MSRGLASLRFRDDSRQIHTINLGTVTNFNNSFQKKTMVTPIVSLDMQSAFPIDMGNSQSYTISFTRRNPISPNNSSSDSTQWTNERWYRELTRFVDRWQARTNGCLFSYVPLTDDSRNTVFYHGDVIQDVGGYIRNLSRTYDTTSNEIIRGSLTFSVGTMYVNNTDTPPNPSESESVETMSVLISDSSQTNWYALLWGGDDASNKYNCIESIEITGGMEEPFEYAKIVIPKRKLMEQIPTLYGDIVDYQNRLVINCMGKHNMYVDKVKVSGQSITITAFTYAHLYQQATLNADVSSRPFEHILNILTNPQYGVMYSEADLISNYDAQFNNELVFFKGGTKIWRALQICATLLRCRLFFANNKVYLIDYTKKISNTDTTLYETKWLDYIDLQGSNRFRDRLVSVNIIDPDGTAPVKNSMVVVYGGSNGNISYEWTDTSSYEKYGVLSKGTVQVPELNEGQALQFAENHIRYIREPQRSITFTLKEMYGQSGEPDKVWQSFFGASAQTGLIVDRDNNDYVNNISYLDIGVVYNKLCLSSYTRKFPEGTCEYTFGTVANIDLPNNLSQTSNTLNTL